MTKSDLTYRADQLLIKYKKLTSTEQEELENILLEIEGLNLKVTRADRQKCLSSDPDPNINSQVPRIRRRKKHSNNLQQLTLF